VKAFKIYAFFIPICLLQGACYGCLRAIGRQNHIIYAQILSNFIVHYIALAIFLGTWDQVNNGVVYTFGITYFCMNLYLIIVLYRIDWEAAADEMRKSIGATELNEVDCSKSTKANSC